MSDATDKPTPPPPPQPTINIEDEMRQSYTDYAMSVIVGRALPDARDGLKPVHRRVLYAMHDASITWNRPYRKAARVVGDVMGVYHPHGDAAIYDTVVRMAQDFSLRYPLIDGQGNFGSVDGDPPAAMRYTEVRMARMASELLADIDKETVDFQPTYDDANTEPTVLPARVPNLLVNGAAGIAVGMATNVPPHNLAEIVDGCLALIENPATTIEELIRLIPGPDFPTGGIVCGRTPIELAYRTGRGVLTIRSRTEIETDPRTDRDRIVVTEIPYQVNKARMIERMADLVNDKVIEGISDLRDESSREGMRVVIELKRDAIPDVVLNQLYRHTPLQDSFGINLLAIVDGRPVLLDLKRALAVFLDHRREVVVRRTQYELREAERRQHVLEGFAIALDHLDEVIALIRAAPDPPTAKAQLMERFELSEIQSQEILNLRLQRLTSMERDKILEELAEVRKLIERLLEILGSRTEVDAIIAAELREIRETYGDERRTELREAVDEILPEDLIAEEDMVVTISHEGYVKRNPVTDYRAQKRGGRGVTGAKTRDEDFVEHLFVASTHAYLLFFTSAGRLHWRKVYELPQGSRSSRGRAIVNLLALAEGERVTAILPVRTFETGHYIVFATARGQVKKTDVMAYSNPRAAGIIAVGLDEGDQLIGVGTTHGEAEIVLSTRNGQAIRFSESAVRAMGRGARGVRGVNLGEGDEVIGLAIVEEGAALLSVSERGYGKQTKLDEYRVTNRGGKGIISMKVTERTGPVESALMVRESDEVMLITSSAKLIRTRVAEIRTTGRSAQGVRLINLDADERVVAVAHVAESEDANGNGATPEGEVALEDDAVVDDPQPSPPEEPEPSDDA